jgi:hypothetical protein
MTMYCVSAAQRDTTQWPATGEFSLHVLDQKSGQFNLANVTSAHAAYDTGIPDALQVLNGAVSGSVTLETGRSLKIENPHTGSYLTLYKGGVVRPMLDFVSVTKSVVDVVTGTDTIHFEVPIGTLAITCAPALLTYKLTKARPIIAGIVTALPVVGSPSVVCLDTDASGYIWTNPDSSTRIPAYDYKLLNLYPVYTSAAAPANRTTGSGIVTRALYTDPTNGFLVSTDERFTTNVQTVGVVTYYFELWDAPQSKTARHENASPMQHPSLTSTRFVAGTQQQYYEIHLVHLTLPVRGTVMGGQFSNVLDYPFLDVEVHINEQSLVHHVFATDSLHPVHFRCFLDGHVRDTQSPYTTLVVNTTPNRTTQQNWYNVHVVCRLPSGTVLDIQPPNALLHTTVAPAMDLLNNVMFSFVVDGTPVSGVNLP